MILSLQDIYEIRQMKQHASFGLSEHKLFVNILQGGGFLLLCFSSLNNVMLSYESYVERIRNSINKGTVH